MSRTSTASEERYPVRGWVRWLSVGLSVPLLILCALLPIARGEKVYRFLLPFQDDYAPAAWAIIVMCRWIAWLILIIAAAQIATLTSLLFRPRRKTVVASYIGIAALLLLFLVWAYHMLPSVGLMDAVQRPPGAR